MIHNVQLTSGTLALNVQRCEAPFKLEDLCGFAVRQNPKRSFLFVSKVLGKHYPVRPSKAMLVNSLLARKVFEKGVSDNALFVGFAETATGLGNGIYDEWLNLSQASTSLFIHTTRYSVDSPVLFNFEEEHSHATGHTLYSPVVNIAVSSLSTLVLIDDEITTGKTMANFMSEFTAQFPNITKVVIVSIKSWLGSNSETFFKTQFPNLDVSSASILEGEYSFHQNPEFVPETMPNVEGTTSLKDQVIPFNFGRNGLSGKSVLAIDPLSLNLDVSKKTLVIGTGEFHYQPLLLAKWLEDQGTDVFYQSTTRSPISEGYDIRKKLSFIDNYNDNIPNFIYNVAPDDYDQVVVCFESTGTYGCSVSTLLNANSVFFKQ